MLQLEELSKVTNRSTNQTKFLFGLCNNDFNKLVRLEQLLTEKNWLLIQR